MLVFLRCQVHPDHNYAVAATDGDGSVVVWDVRHATCVQLSISLSLFLGCFFFALGGFFYKFKTFLLVDIA